MASTGLRTAAIVDDLVSGLMVLGLFDQVNAHEPTNAPGRGLTAAVFMKYIGPVPQNSGLASTSAVVEIYMRLTLSTEREPKDQIDTDMTDALDAVFASLHGGFKLSGDADYVDLLGITGRRLEGEAGYFNQSGTVYRAMMITVPVVIEDAWTQAP